MIANANLTSTGRVFLRSSANVRGFVRSGSTITKQLGATVQGGEFPNSATPSTPTSWTINFPDTNQGDVFLPPNQTRTLAPGSWGNLNVQSRSTVFLRHGSYYFQSLNTEPEARIMLDKSAGPIFIYVKNSYTLKGRYVSNGGPDGEVLTGVLGTSVVYIEVPLLGTVVAPNATVELRRPPDNSPHRGAVFGKGIHVFSNATVLRLPFSFKFPCVGRDTDMDGANDCEDVCLGDPNKVAPGICGCGQSEADDDNDGVPNCIDFCKNDPNNTTPGQCGCPPLGAAPAGTPCGDNDCAPVPGSAPLTCNGAGVCGPSCPPAAGCTKRRIGTGVYWFCPGPVTWAQAAPPAGRSRTARWRASTCASRARPSATSPRSCSRDRPGLGRTTSRSRGPGAGARSPATTSPVLVGRADRQPDAGPVRNWAANQPDPVGDCGALGTTGEWSSLALHADPRLHL